MKVIIIGGVAGGATAAARIRRLDEKAEIVILERSGSFPKLKILYPNPRLRYFQNTLLCGYSESSASSWLPLDKESVSSICIATGRCFHTPAGC